MTEARFELGRIPAKEHRYYICSLPDCKQPLFSQNHKKFQHLSIGFTIWKGTIYALPQTHTQFLASGQRIWTIKSADKEGGDLPRSGMSGILFDHICIINSPQLGAPWLERWTRTTCKGLYASCKFRCMMTFSRARAPLKQPKRKLQVPGCIRLQSS